MNYALAREVYGGLPWAIDGMSFTTLSAMLRDMRNGVPFSGGTKRLNSISVMLLDGSVVSEGVLADNAVAKDEKLVSITYLNGPITKNGGISSYGTKELSDELFGYDADPNIVGHIILGDSGGGSSTGMEVMCYCLDNLSKPTAFVIERGGIACSAAYGIAAHCGRIFSESETATVGSIGSMISFAAQPNKTVNSLGEKQVTMYATPSTKKNLWFEEALNNDNYDLALSEVLDPHVNYFIADMKNMRPEILESQLDGSTYDAGKVIGTLVDEIGGIKEAINFVNSESNNNFSAENNKINSLVMNADEIKSKFPEAHAAIFNAGVSSETDRVGAWMAHADTDLETVKSGIESGKAISSSQTQSLIVKMHSKTVLSDLNKDSAPKVVVPPAEGKDAEISAEQKEFDAVYSKHKVPFDSKIK